MLLQYGRRTGQCRRLRRRERKLEDAPDAVPPYHRRQAETDLPEPGARRRDGRDGEDRLLVPEDGYPIQKRGATGYRGLFFVGFPWLQDAKSGLLFGVGADAAHIAERIAMDWRRDAGAGLVLADGWPSLDCCCV